MKRTPRRSARSRPGRKPGKKRTPSSRPRRGILADLVHQFTDPYAFYRELIQNAIDAGSIRVEVKLRYEDAAEAGVGTAVVRDFGAGMNRSVIEQFLLKVFRSTKEDDFTKIGKFGVGFVSVFAIEPDLVVVETGRDGEDWRILLHPDLRYELLAHPDPVEGTTVSLHRQMTRAEYVDFAERSLAAVQKWCRHSEAEVSFEASGLSSEALIERTEVREPFGVEAPYTVEYEEEGTRIVAGYAGIAQAPFAGFYNRGLTLHEAERPIFPGVSFKIQSRYLEHTLTRDNIRRDENFAKALQLLEKVVRKQLIPQLPAALREAAGRDQPDPAYRSLLEHAQAHHTQINLEMSLGLARTRSRFRPSRPRRLPADQIWFPLVGGGAVHAADLARSTRQQKTDVLWARSETPLTSALIASGRPVLWHDPDDAGSRAVLAAACRIARNRTIRASQPAGKAFSLASPPADPPAAALELAEGSQALLRAAGLRVADVVVAEVSGAGSDRPVVWAESLGVPATASDALAQPAASVIRRILRWRGSSQRVLCFNLAHDLVRTALLVAGHSPSLAGLILVRAVLLGWQPLADRADERMLEAVLAT